MNIAQIINGARTGTLDAKSEVMRMIERMTPAQRRQLNNTLPQVEQFARQAGVDAGDFSKEVRAHLIY